MYALLRIAMAIPTLLGVTVFTFLMVHMSPGDPLTVLTGGRISQEVLDRIRVFYGFDQPLPVQYGRWLARIVVGDFGVSFSTGRAVAPELLAALANSLKILVIAAPLTVLGGWLLGSLAAWRSGTRLGHALSVLMGGLVSVPSYWFGMLLVALFGVTLNWLPVMSMGPGVTWAGWFSLEGLSYAILPTLAIIIAPVGILARSTKAAIAATLDQDFPDALRARGLPESHVRRRVARNALPSLFTIYGLQIAYMFSGLVLVEAIFAWPGLGNYLTLAITARDMPAIQAGILLSALVFVLLNLGADLLQSAFDRRARR
jgi:peptide/nickel transport system permease protein